MLTGNVELEPCEEKYLLNSKVLLHLTPVTDDAKVLTHISYVTQAGQGSWDLEDWCHNYLGSYGGVIESDDYFPYKLPLFGAGKLCDLSISLWVNNKYIVRLVKLVAVRLADFIQEGRRHIQVDGILISPSRAGCGTFDSLVKKWNRKYPNNQHVAKVSTPLVWVAVLQIDI